MNKSERMIDLTHQINENIKEFPEDPKIKLKKYENNECIITNLSIAMHTGTHIDAPYHYLKNGKKISEYEINEFCGKASILHMKNNNKKEISIEDINIENQLEKIIIINTGWFNYFNSSEYFYENPYLSEELCDFLIKNNIKGIAIDTCSVDKYGENKIHKKLLKNNIWIVENLTNCDKLKEKKYEAFFIPLKIESEASIIRAFVKKIK